MLRISLNSGRPPVLHGNQHPTGIGTVVRTSGLYNLLHDFFDYTGIGWSNLSSILPEIREAYEVSTLEMEKAYLISITSFSFALLISSIFLISPSVSF